MSSSSNRPQPRDASVVEDDDNNDDDYSSSTNETAEAAATIAPTQKQQPMNNNNNNNNNGLPPSSQMQRRIRSDPPATAKTNRTTTTTTLSHRRKEEDDNTNVETPTQPPPPGIKPSGTTTTTAQLPSGAEITFKNTLQSHSLMAAAAAAQQRVGGRGLVSSQRQTGLLPTIREPFVNDDDDDDDINETMENGGGAQIDDDDDDHHNNNINRSNGLNNRPNYNNNKATTNADPQQSPSIHIHITRRGIMYMVIVIVLLLLMSAAIGTVLGIVCGQGYCSSTSTSKSSSSSSTSAPPSNLDTNNNTAPIQPIPSPSSSSSSSSSTSAAPVVNTTTIVTDAPTTIMPSTLEPTTLSPTTVALYSSTDIPTLAPFYVPPRQDCYTDLDDLQLIVRAKDPTKNETFVLCPNTVFDIGYQNASGWCCVNGFHPIWTRKDTTYQCGKDGKSTNNCTVRGGSVQILGLGYNFPGESQTNAVLKGITFENAADISSLMVVEGDFYFIDCIFKNHKNLGAIKLAYIVPYEGNRRHLNRYEFLLKPDSLSFYSSIGRDATASMAYYDNMKQHHEQIARHHRSRRSQNNEEQPIPLRHRVTFDNCLFFNNSMGQADPYAHYGVIFAETDVIDVIINNSIFMNNYFGRSDVKSDGFAVNVKFGSTLEIHNTCFLNNNFIGCGAVLVDDGVNYTTSRNYGTNDTTNLACQFMSVGDSFTCVDYDSKTCLASK